ncbi:hypothetical protein M3Y98_01121700 [Aphelenchoides besseyi]|nr:hypothetical protein M3Y98_01121700 [Aphelenchoides besseyi]
MGCQQSTTVIRPIDVISFAYKNGKYSHLIQVYDSTSLSKADSGIVSLDVQSLEHIAHSQKDGFSFNKKPKTSNIVDKKFNGRRSSIQSRYSVWSIDSGMGSPTTDLSVLFRNAVKQQGFSIDISRAKTNAPVVSLCAQRLNMEIFTEERQDGRPCTVYWHSQVLSDMKSYVRGPDSRVNKFPGMTELSKKVALTRAIRSMTELFPDEYNFYPKSWILPPQYDEFRAYAASHPSNWFIVKPDEGCQGTGIYLINSSDQLHSRTDKMLIQEYVDDPYLLPDNLKFDFRVYVVIRSINPLSIYIAREGTEKYFKPTTGNFTHLFSHLTNYSLNKSSSSYVHSNTLRDQMEANGLKTRKLWHEVKMIVVKTVLSMVPEIMINYEQAFNDVAGPQCFQIMGFDVIVRKDGMPFLLEVNSSPSLTIDHTNEYDGISVRSIVDEVIKVPLVRDSLLLVLNQLDGPLLTPNAVENNDPNRLNNNVTEDDSAMLRKKRKPHLSEIFPARYGQNSKHLLILDRAVYLFMQFVNIKLTLNITLLGARAFLKKCHLTDVVSFEELERNFASISYYFHGSSDQMNAGLPFHGFLQLLFRIANIKFSFCHDQLAALQRLFAYCDASLRHYGIRSTRLRRTEVENDENANSVEIYLLPNRMRKSGRISGRRQTLNNSATKKRSRSEKPPFNSTPHLPPVGFVH